MNNIYTHTHTDKNIQIIIMLETNSTQFDNEDASTEWQLY